MKILISLCTILLAYSINGGFNWKQTTLSIIIIVYVVLSELAALGKKALASRKLNVLKDALLAEEMEIEKTAENE